MKEICLWVQACKEPFKIRAWIHILVNNNQNLRWLSLEDVWVVQDHQVAIEASEEDPIKRVAAEATEVEVPGKLVPIEAWVAAV